MRTCVACRVVRPAHALLRLRRRSDGVVVPDVAQRRTGRSAWLCPTRACVEQAVRRRAFRRALAGSRGLVVRDPELPLLWSTILADVDARVHLLRRTAESNAASTSAIAAVARSLQDQRGRS